MSQRRILCTALAVGVMGIGATAHAQGISRIWAIDDGERIRQDDLDYPLASSPENALWDGATVRLFAARNEMVAFQLVIEASPSGASAVDVQLAELSDGTHAIANADGATDPFDYRGRRIELFTEHYFNITAYNNGDSWWWYGARPVDIRGNDYFGWLPDALIPFEVIGPGLGGVPFDVAPSTNQAVWIDIWVPRDAVPGVYDGELIVLENGASVATLPLELRVYGFTLPDETHLKNYFIAGGDDGEGIRSKHPCTEGSPEYDLIEGRYFQMAHRHRMDLTMNSDLPTMQDHFSRYITGSYYLPVQGYEGPGEGVGHGTYSIGTYDQPDNGWSSGFYPNTEADWWAAADAWVNWFAANAPGTEIFKYFPDEPEHDPTTLYPIIVERAAWLHDNPGPGNSLPVYDTVHIDPELYGSIDFWTVTGQAGYDPGDGDLCGYDLPKVAERHAAGEKVGVYNSQRPGHGAVEAFDADAVEARVTAWVAWKYLVDQYFDWQTTYWNYYGYTPRNVFQGQDTDGGGFFFYPGQEKDFPAEDRGLEGPLSCIRMKNWRRGAQDYEYMWLAREAGLGAQVDEIVDGIVPHAFDDYGDGFASQNDPPPWAERGYLYEQARRQLAELLEATLPPSDAGAGGVGGAGGAGQGAGAAQPANGATDEPGEGCGCRLASSRPAPFGALAALLLATVRRWRRRAVRPVAQPPA